MQKQRTIKQEAVIRGTGLHFGKEAVLTFKPAEVNSGINFVRVDLPGKPRIKVSMQNVLSAEKSPRRTSVGKGDVEIHTIEHLLAALNCLRIDNLLIEINNIEVPGLDGSTILFYELLSNAGIVEQQEKRKVFVLKDPIWLEENDTSIVVLPYPGFRVSYTLDYNHPNLDVGYLSLDINEETFKNEIAPSRTFCLEEEVEDLRKIGLGQGANFENTLVVGKAGVIENSLRFENEFLRHKMLDLIGDFYLIGPIHCHVVALKSGHLLNIKILSRIIQQMRRFEASGISSVSREAVDTSGEIDINGIVKILPHRYPFLLVDKILSITPGKCAVGAKNVTMNEHFFTGHFPQKPVMPGVLIVEAMAQVGGVIMLSPNENRGKLAYFMAANNIKFRRPVVPGDRLIMEVEVVKVRSRTGQVRAKALVEDKVVAEADLMFALAEN